MTTEIPSTVCSPLLKVEGKRVLITGASSGIGLATAELFARNGAVVALNYLSEDARGAAQVIRLRAEGLKVFAAPGNVAEAASIDITIPRALEQLGGLDFLVNNAGTSGTKEPIALSDMDALTEEFWQSILSTNLVGPFRCTRLAATALRDSRGAVVNTASIGGFDAVGSSMAYGASKAGLINMTKNLARALAPEVRVNAVAPGYVESAWTADWPDTKKTMLIERSLLKRACRPGDIAEVIYFLCTSATVVTGQTLIADAGFTLS
jgi:3-oxoacyl-[acyl-carrier protein] reductase